MKNWDGSGRNKAIGRDSTRLDMDCYWPLKRFYLILLIQQNLHYLSLHYEIIREHTVRLATAHSTLQVYSLRGGKGRGMTHLVCFTLSLLFLVSFLHWFRFIGREKSRPEYNCKIVHLHSILGRMRGNPGRETVSDPSTAIIHLLYRYHTCIDV